MLTRETALQRLRATGSLSAEAPPANSITAEQAADPLALQLKRIIGQRAHQPGQRCLAPSANHAVLP